MNSPMTAPIASVRAAARKKRSHRVQPQYEQVTECLSIIGRALNRRLEVIGFEGGGSG